MFLVQLPLVNYPILTLASQTDQWMKLAAFNFLFFIKSHVLLCFVFITQCFLARLPMVVCHCFHAQVSILLWAKDRLCDLALVPIHQGLQCPLSQVCPPNAVQQREGRNSTQLVCTSKYFDLFSFPHRIDLCSCNYITLFSFISLAVLQEIDEYIAQAKDRSYETMMRFGKRGLNLAANAAVTAATKVSCVLSSCLSWFDCLDKFLHVCWW